MNITKTTGKTTGKEKAAVGAIATAALVTTLAITQPGPQPGPQARPQRDKDTSSYELQRAFTQHEVITTKVHKTGPNKIQHLVTQRTGPYVSVLRTNKHGVVLGSIPGHKSRKDRFRDGELKRKNAIVLDPEDPMARRVRKRPNRGDQ